MIQELVELWSWFFGMIAGWGATTIGIVAALIVIYVKHLRLKTQVNQLYSRLVSFERDVSLRENQRDK